MPSSGHDGERTRRSLLRALAIAGAAGIAGCRGGDGGGTPASDGPARKPTSETPSPTPTPRDSTTDAETRAGTTTGTGPTPGTRAPGREFVDWRFGMAGDAVAGPAIGPDAVYAGTAEATYQESESGASRLFALDRSDGTERWRFDLGPVNVAGRPAVVDGTVAVVTGVEGSIFARNFALQGFSTGGERRWELALSGPGEILGVRDGTLYLTTHDGNYGTDAYPQTAFTAVDPESGRKRWHETLGHLENVVLAGDLVATYTWEANGLVVLDAADGSERFRKRGFRPLGADSGGLYAVSRDAGAVAKLGADGSEAWRTDLSDGRDGRLVGDAVVVVDGSGTAHAFDAADGSERWTADAFASGDHPLAAAIEQPHLYLAHGGTLAALHRDDGLRWSVDTSFYNVSSLRASGDRVLAGDDDSGVTAFTSGGDRQWRYLWKLGGFDARDDSVAVTTAEGEVLGVSR